MRFFIHQTFPFTVWIRPVRCVQRRAFSFFINQVFSCQHHPRPIKAWQHRHERVSVWKISTRSDFAQPPNSASAPSNNVPLPIISRSEPSTNMAQVAPMPIEKPSVPKAPDLFHREEASARPTTIQLVTISGIKSLATDTGQMRRR